MNKIDIRDSASAAQLVSTDYGEWGPTLTVTQSMIDEFADLTGDRQWIHVDVERSKRESPFGGPVAHGFLTLSLLPTLDPGLPVELTGERSQINYGADSLRFLRPVPAGSRLRARNRVLAVVLHRRGTVLTTETAIHVVEDDQPALLYAGKILYEHGPTAEHG